jgi:hypothetical protein
MDEYISKQKVLDYLNGYLHSLGNGGADTLLFDRGQRRALINSIQDLLAVKAADVQPVKHGRWIAIRNGKMKHWKEQCSVCKRITRGRYPYCRSCGARMDGDVNE